MKTLNILKTMLLASIITISFASCDVENPLPDEPETGQEGEEPGEEPGDDPGNTSESAVADIPYFTIGIDGDSSVRAAIDYMPAGIYIYDGTELFAKGTDGSWFHIPDMNHSRAGDVPEFWPANFTMSDGNRREAFVDAYYVDLKHKPTSDIGYVRAMTQYPTSDEMYLRFKMVNGDLTRTSKFANKTLWGPLAHTSDIARFMSSQGLGKWEKATGETICGIPTTRYRYSFPSPNTVYYDFHVAANHACLKTTGYDEAVNATYVDTEAGDMSFMLHKIAALLGERCASTIEELDQMLPQDIYAGNRWMSEWFPRSLDIKLPKYTAPLTISEFHVYRYTNSNLPDGVGDIRFIGTGVTYDDVKAYIATIVSNNPDLDKSVYSVDEPASGLIAWEGYIDYCSPDDPHELGDVSNNYSWKVFLTGEYLEVRFSIITVLHL